MGLYGSPDLDRYKTDDKKVNNKKPKKPSNKIYDFLKNMFAIIGIVATFVFIITIFSDPQSETPSEDIVNTINKKSNYINKDDYIPICIEYNYKDIARNPSEYKGKNATFTGKVLQVLEESNIVNLRMDITKDDYGFWSDTIYVLYERKSTNEQRILVDDIITVYGQLSGLCTYTTVLGDTVSIPEISVLYYDLIE